MESKARQTNFSANMAGGLSPPDQAGKVYQPINTS